MDDTFLGLTTTKVYTIRNNSDYQLKYRWMKYKNIEDDKARKEKFAGLATNYILASEILKKKIIVFQVLGVIKHYEKCRDNTLR